MPAVRRQKPTRGTPRAGRRTMSRMNPPTVAIPGMPSETSAMIACSVKVRLSLFPGIRLGTERAQPIPARDLKVG